MTAAYANSLVVHVHLHVELDALSHNTYTIAKQQPNNAENVIPYGAYFLSNASIYMARLLRSMN
jgi:hypothetical protein